MFAVHCDKCGKVLLLEDNEGSRHKQMNESGWCKVYLHGGYDSDDFDLCKECYDDLRTAVRNESV